MTPKILRVEDGAVLDVSQQQRFRDLYRRDMRFHERNCAKGINGACAAFVASAIRAGSYRWAWDFMLDHYDRNERAGLDMTETEYGADRPPWLTFSNFPKALDWFLRDTGYLADDAPPPKFTGPVKLRAPAGFSRPGADATVKATGPTSIPGGGRRVVRDARCACSSP